MQVCFIQLSWLYLPIEVNLYSWQDIFHLCRPPPASPHLLLIFRVYISCQSGFRNDLHLPWFLASGQKLGRFERDKLDFPNGVTCEEPVMPSGARWAAALWCAVAAFCVFLTGRRWCSLTLYRLCFVTFSCLFGPGNLETIQKVWLGQISRTDPLNLPDPLAKVCKGQRFFLYPHKQNTKGKAKFSHIAT